MDDGHTHYTPATGIPELKQAICDAYDFSNFPTIVDVGGGHGLLITDDSDTVSGMCNTYALLTPLGLDPASFRIGNLEQV